MRMQRVEAQELQVGDEFYYRPDTSSPIDWIHLWTVIQSASTLKYGPQDEVDVRVKLEPDMRIAFRRFKATEKLRIKERTT